MQEPTGCKNATSVQHVLAHILLYPYKSHPSMKNSVLTFLHPIGTRMPYVTRNSHQMQKYKFSVTCPGALFMETTLDPPEHEK
jgi:hypothetical protein